MLAERGFSVAEPRRNLNIHGAWAPTTGAAASRSPPISICRNVGIMGGFCILRILTSDFILLT